MTDAATRDLMASIRAGHVPTAAQTVATITSLTELDAYRKGLSARGALTADAMAAIRDRMDYLQARGLK